MWCSEEQSVCSAAVSVCVSDWSSSSSSCVPQLMCCVSTPLSAPLSPPLPLVFLCWCVLCLPLLCQLRLFLFLLLFLRPLLWMGECLWFLLCWVSSRGLFTRIRLSCSSVWLWVSAASDLSRLHSDWLKDSACACVCVCMCQISTLHFWFSLLHLKTRNRKKLIKWKVMWILFFVWGWNVKKP